MEATTASIEKCACRVEKQFQKAFTHGSQQINQNIFVPSVGSKRTTSLIQTILNMPFVVCAERYSIMPVEACLSITLQLLPNIAVKALPSVAGTRRKRRAPYLKRYTFDHDGSC